MQAFLLAKVKNVISHTPMSVMSVLSVLSVMFANDKPDHLFRMRAGRN